MFLFYHNDTLNILVVTNYEWIGHEAACQKMLSVRAWWFHPSSSGRDVDLKSCPDCLMTRYSHSWLVLWNANTITLVLRIGDTCIRPREKCRWLTKQVFSSRVKSKCLAHAWTSPDVITEELSFFHCSHFLQVCDNGSLENFQLVEVQSVFVGWKEWFEKTCLNYVVDGIHARILSFLGKSN